MSVSPAARQQIRAWTQANQRAIRLYAGHGGLQEPAPPGIRVVSRKDLKRERISLVYGLISQELRASTGRAAAAYRASA